MTLTVGNFSKIPQSNQITFKASSNLPKFQITSRKNRRFWAKCVQNNEEGTGRGVMAYAARWANMMEKAMAKGSKLEDIAEKTSCYSDTEGLSGCLYNIAVDTLSRVWKHGKALKNWHNAANGVEKDAQYAVNAAVLNINI